MITAKNRKWWVLVAMTGSLSMILLDQIVVSVALPSIQDDLDLTQTQLQWVIGARALQGVGAAVMIPPSAAIVIAEFPLAERGRASSSSSSRSSG